MPMIEELKTLILVLHIYRIKTKMPVLEKVDVLNEGTEIGVKREVESPHVLPPTLVSQSKSARTIRKKHLTDFHMEPVHRKRKPGNIVIQMYCFEFSVHWIDSKFNRMLYKALESKVSFVTLNMFTTNVPMIEESNSIHNPSVLSTLFIQPAFEMTSPCLSLLIFLSTFAEQCYLIQFCSGNVVSSPLCNFIDFQMLILVLFLIYSFIL